MADTLFTPQHIDVYWWNMGHKTKEYSGPLEGYLEKRGITVEEIPHPEISDYKGLRFTIPVSSATATFTWYGTGNNLAALKAIQMFLVMMGDRAQVKTPFKTVNIN